VFRRFACTAVLAAFSLGLSPAVFAQSDAAPSQVQPVPSQDFAGLLADPNLDPVVRNALELLQLINAARAEAGLPALLLDARLTAAASAHATDMATGHFCRHGGSDGSTSRTRIKAHGYPAGNWFGENIICSRRTPERAMKWWMASAPHRRNILHRHYTHIGIGYDPNGQYGPDWTLNFAAGATDTVAPAFLSAPGAPVPSSVEEAVLHPASDSPPGED
jgi:uncharacterized protein YkwD